MKGEPKRITFRWQDLNPRLVRARDSVDLLFARLLPFICPSPLRDGVCLKSRGARGEAGNGTNIRNQDPGSMPPTQDLKRNVLQMECEVRRVETIGSESAEKRGT
jgi:hypothetical protein